MAIHNRTPGIFFTFAETKKASAHQDARTLERIGEPRDPTRQRLIRSTRYGVPKAHHGDVEQLPPSWEKLKQSANEAKSWLDLTLYRRVRLEYKNAPDRKAN